VAKFYKEIWPPIARQADSVLRPSDRMECVGLEQRIMKREYTVLYTPIEDGWIMATVPELPGAVTQGRNLEEAREMIQEAVALLLQSYRERAVKDAPSASIWETVSVDVAVP
jgi:predicted RNase H-like HicB family nuclease